MNERLFGRVLMAGLLLALLAGSGLAPTQAADFNGYADLAVGVPHEDITFVSGTKEDAGAVQVLYGTSDGLTGAGDQFWHQGAPIRDSAEEGDHFGYALAAIPTLRYHIFCRWCYAGTSHGRVEYR